MTDKQALIGDLDFAAKIAREAASTPLLGGPFFLIWSGLLIPTLLLHGAVLTGLLPLDPKSLGMIWMVYGVTGGILSGITGSKRQRQTGAHTFLNRLSRASGITVGLLILTFVLTLSGAVMRGVFAVDQYNLILPFAFGLQAFHMMMLGHMGGKKYLQRAGYVAALTMIVTLLFNSSSAIYFVAAISSFFSMALPGFIELREERAELRG